MRVRLVSALALLFVLHAAVASAQQTQSAGVFGAGGVVFQKAFYDSPKAGSTVGPTLGFQIRTGRAGAAAFTFELMAQPLPARIRRPGYEDSFAPFYAMAASKSAGARTSA